MTIRYAKYLLILIKACVIVTLMVVTSEFILRALGYMPYGHVLEDRSIETRPAGLFTTDSILGFAYQKGTFEVTLNKKLVYKLRIDKDGQRNNPFNTTHCKKNISVYGCSFFAGMGINDDEVLSAQITKMNSDWCVRNYSIPGHGFTSQLLQFKKHISDNNVSKYAVFSLASFHLPRNVGSFTYLRSFGNISEAPVLFPSARISHSSSLSFSNVQVVPGIEKFARISALYTEVLFQYDRWRFSDQYQFNVFCALCDSIVKHAEKHNVQVLFDVITKDDISKRMIAHLQAKNYPYIISRVDYKDSSLNLMPADGHPNADAHYIYAEEISKYFNIPVQSVPN